MRVVIQRVKKASVKINGNVFSSINCGLLVFVGFGEKESKEDLRWISKKIISLRVFSDNEGKLNKSIQDINGDILIVSQFSLHALLKKGNRPSFIRSCNYIHAKSLYDDFIDFVKKDFCGVVKKGLFGSDMKIDLVNDGPLTFFIDTKNKE
tara:strand:- start:329 stop:781 length:453 start_codon:yes stop_codon:yes gene_type:complete